MPSWIVVIIIAIGGTMVVLGNIYYPILRESEKKVVLADSAIDMIKQELEFNRDYALNIKKNISLTNTLADKFKVGAWETISRGSLINSLDNETTKRLLEIYRLIYDLNDANANLIDTLIGLRAAIGNVEIARNLFYNKINIDIDKLLNNLIELSEKNPKLIIIKTQPVTPVAEQSMPHSSLKEAPSSQPADTTAQQPNLQEPAPLPQQPSEQTR